MRNIFLSIIFFASSLSAITYTDGRMVTGMLRMSVSNYTALAVIGISTAHTNDFVIVRQPVSTYPAGFYQRLSTGWTFIHELTATNWMHRFPTFATNSVIRARIIAVSNSLDKKISTVTNVKLTDVTNTSSIVSFFTNLSALQISRSSNTGGGLQFTNGYVFTSGFQTNFFLTYQDLSGNGSNVITSGTWSYAPGKNKAVFFDTNVVTSGLIQSPTATRTVAYNFKTPTIVNCAKFYLTMYHQYTGVIYMVWAGSNALGWHDIWTNGEPHYFDPSYQTTVRTQQHTAYWKYRYTITFSPAYPFAGKNLIGINEIQLAYCEFPQYTLKGYIDIRNYNASNRIQSVSNTLLTRIINTSNSFSGSTYATNGYGQRFTDYSNRMTWISNSIGAVQTNGYGSTFIAISNRIRSVSNTVANYHKSTNGYGTRWTKLSNRISSVSNKQGMQIYSISNKLTLKLSALSNRTWNGTNGIAVKIGIITNRITSVGDYYSARIISVSNRLGEKVANLSNKTWDMSNKTVKYLTNLMKLKDATILGQAYGFAQSQDTANLTIVRAQIKAASNTALNHALAISNVLWFRDESMSNSLQKRIWTNTKKILSVSNSLYYNTINEVDGMYNVLHNQVVTNSNRSFVYYLQKSNGVSRTKLSEFSNSMTNYYWRFEATNNYLVSKPSYEFNRQFRNPGVYTCPAITFSTSSIVVVSTYSQVSYATNQIVTTNALTNTSAVTNPVQWHKMNTNGNSEIGVNPGLEGTGGTFSNAKFGKGLRIDPGDVANYMYFQGMIVSNESFAVDFWYKTYEDFATVSGKAFHGIFWYAGSGGGDFGIAWETDGSFFVDIAGSQGSEVNASFVNGTNFVAGDLIHIAMSFDNNLTGGNKVRAWMNNTELAKNSETSASYPLTYLNLSLANWWGGGANSADGVLDNLKTYDYPKSDFSFDMANEGTNIGGIVVSSNCVTNYVVTPSSTNLTTSTNTNIIGLVTIGTGTMVFQTTADLSGGVIYKHMTVFTQSILTNIQYHVQAYYNNGNPEFRVVSLQGLDNGSTILSVGSVFWEKGVDATEIHIFDYSNYARDPAVQLFGKDIRLYGYVRESGLILGDTTNKGLTLSSGAVWYGTKRYSLPAIDTTLPGGIVHEYFQTNGNWYWVTNNRWDNLHFQAVSNRREVDTNCFVVNWIYRDIDVSGDNCLFRVYGSTSNLTTLVLAKAEAPPSSLPPILQLNSILVGRIIVGKHSNTVTEIDSSFVETFVSSPVPPRHNNLGGLQGGVPGEYYHLTGAEVNSIANIGYMVSNQLQTKTEASATSNSLYNNSISATNGLHVNITGDVQNSIATTNLATREYLNQFATNDRVKGQTNGYGTHFANYSNRMTEMSNRMTSISNAIDCTNGIGIRFTSVTQGYRLMTNSFRLMTNGFILRTNGLGTRITSTTQRYRLMTNGFILRTNGLGTRITATTQGYRLMTNAYILRTNGIGTRISAVTQGYKLMTNSFRLMTNGFRIMTNAYRLMTNAYILRTNNLGSRITAVTQGYRTMTNGFHVMSNTLHGVIGAEDYSQDLKFGTNATILNRISLTNQANRLADYNQDLIFGTNTTLRLQMTAYSNVLIANDTKVTNKLHGVMNGFFGEAYQTNGSWSVTAGTGGANYTNYSGYTNSSQTNGLIWISSNRSWQVRSGGAGLYLISYAGYYTYTSGGNTQVATFFITINGTTYRRSRSAITSGGNTETCPMSGQAFLNLSVGDFVKIRLTSTGGTLQVKAMSFMIRTIK